jgi:hypothetical protein
MPDITMCKGAGCPKKENCYRYTATPSPHWQSWFMNVPWEKEKPNECHMYCPVKEEKENG